MNRTEVENNINLQQANGITIFLNAIAFIHFLSKKRTFLDH